jgi:hypothetical protein
MAAPVTGFEPGTLWSHGEGNAKKICYMAAITEDNKHKCPECGSVELYDTIMNGGAQYIVNSIKHGEGCSLSIYNFCQQNPRVAIGGKRKTKNVRRGRRHSRRRRL